MKQTHIPILKAYDELKFNLGKKTLIDFLKGDPNPTIDNNNLDEFNSYGCLYMIEREEIQKIIEELLKHKYLEYETLPRGFQVIKRTSKGAKEIFQKKFEPKLENINKLSTKNLSKTKITEEDKKLFKNLDFFLKGYNPEQKKAIIADNKNILCIAGAGSGKTSVLTKRIEFINKLRGIKQEKILAITFTRKAKEEMQKRLSALGITNADVETFNSFCEKLLRKYEDIAYDNPIKVAEYRDKIAIINNISKKKTINFEMIFEEYFTKRQLREKSKDELFFLFVNDIFSVIDYYKILKEDIKPFYELERNPTKKRIAKIIYEIAVEAKNMLRKKNLRDFTDQITDVLELFQKHQNIIPKYHHILVDEYQDVNEIQVELLRILAPENIFAVGDPRQAIYGWRGSNIKYILEFPKEHKSTEVIELTKNYRSNLQIVDFFNLSIKKLGLADLESTKEKTGGNNIFLLENDTELLEKKLIADAIKNSQTKRSQIFVLARTNKVLENFADFFTQTGIKYTIKSEESYKNEKEPSENEVTLATVHSIKGMEAEEVYLVSANNNSFPNKVQDNFVFSLVKEDNEYDKESEELRLFYVALSRAKNKLIISYTGKYTKFITEEMLKHIEYKPKNKNIFDYASEQMSKNVDKTNTTVLKNIIKEWRAKKANDTGLPVYMIISNAAIEELSKYMPQTKLDLRNIKGLGDMKIAKYGDEILRLIRG